MLNTYDFNAPHSNNFNMKRIHTSYLLFFIISTAQAVNLSQGGYGEAIILPYYTVNNGLNTIFTVNNASSDKVKAIKLNFREGKKGLSVLSFNLYLAPNDMWAAGLVQAESDLDNHQGEDSTAIIIGDTSCTPLLNSGQQFNADELNLEDWDTGMVRSREGYIEIFEMGELDPSSELGQAALHISGVQDCSLFELAFNAGGVWESDLTEQLLPTSGGLSANASIIDVAEGVMLSIDSVVFENFYPPESIYHTPPGNAEVPSLDLSDTTSVLVSEGEIYRTEWSYGYQAIGALLSKSQVESFNVNDPSIAGKSEVVFTFPTKRFHFSESGNPTPPFTEKYNRTKGACEEIELSAWDRDSYHNLCYFYPNITACQGGGVGGLPENLPPVYSLCYATTVLEFLGWDEPGENSFILGARNVTAINSYETGKVGVGFNQDVDSPSGQAVDNIHNYTGLPVIPITFIKMTNGNAVPGIMAQYADTENTFYKTKVKTR